MSETDAARQALQAKIGKKSFAQNTLLMSALTSISRITGFLRLTAIATVIGGGFIADSYNLANVIPNYTYELVLGGILSSIVIPVIIEYLTNKGESEAFTVASIITNFSIAFLGIVALLGTIFAPLIIKSLTALSGNAQDIKYAVFFFRFFSIQIVFYGLAAMTTGILHSYRRFGIPTFAPILNNITVISIVVFLYDPNIKTNPNFALTALAAGTTLGVFLMFLVQVPSLIKIGFRYKLSFDFKHPAIKKIVLLALPLFLYVLGNIIPMWVEVPLAWRYKTGITALQFAWPFFQLPFGIFAVSVVNALFPSLSENITKGNIKEFKAQISLGLRSIGLIIWPASIGIIVLSKPIISLTLRHGRFSLKSAQLTAEVLGYFGFGLFFFAAFFFLLRAFYAKQDTTTPAIISLITMVFNVTIDLILIKTPLGVRGLALGRSLTYMLNFIIILTVLYYKVGVLDKQIFTSNLKFFFASVLMGLIAFFSLNSTSIYFSGQNLQSRFFLFLLPASIGTLTYLSAIIILRSPEIKLLKKLFLKRS